MDRDERSPIGLRVMVVLGVLTLSIVASATAFAATTTTTPSPRNGFMEFRTCMAKHGVKLAQRRRGGTGAGGTPPSTGSGGGNGPGNAPTYGPGGPGGGGGFNLNQVPTNLPKGVTAKKYLAAVKACKSKIPKGGFGAGGANRPQFQDLPPRRGGSGPEPPPGPRGGGGGGRGGGLHRNDPTFPGPKQDRGAAAPQGGRGTDPPGPRPRGPGGEGGVFGLPVSVVN